MPIYEYSCGACGHDFEASQRITEPPLKTCVRCRTDAASRKVSLPSFILKGGGWYADGYSSAGSSGKSSGNQVKAPKETSRDAAAKTEGALSDTQHGCVQERYSA
jgi:putative FmdB family regulatory protein